MGAAKLMITISMKSSNPASATLLRMSRRPASAHGLRRATWSDEPPGSNPVCGSSTVSAIHAHRTAVGAGPQFAAPPRSPVRLLPPHLVDADVPLGIPLVPLYPLREEVDLLRVVEVDPRSLVGHLVVDLGPDVVRRGRVRLTR